MECGTNNYITWAINPNEKYDDPREKMVSEREGDLESDYRKLLAKAQLVG